MSKILTPLIKASGSSKAASPEAITITQNGTYSSTSGFSPVTVDVSSEPVITPTAYFYDFDGTILFEKTKDELTAMGALPSITETSVQMPAGLNKLKFTDWNWTYEEVMSYLENHSFVDVGALFDISDAVSPSVNAAILVVDTVVPNETLKMYYKVQGTGYIQVDNETATTITGTILTQQTIDITFAAAGRHVVKVNITDTSSNDNRFLLTSPSAEETNFKVALKYAYFGNRGFFDQYFPSATAVEEVSFDKIVNGSFNYSLIIGRSYLKHITIPNKVTILSVSAYMLKSVALNPATSSVNMYGCGSLKQLSIPDIVTASGNYNNNYVLERIEFSKNQTVIGDLSNAHSLKYIGIDMDNLTGVNGLSYCYDMKEFVIDNEKNITFGTNCFANSGFKLVDIEKTADTTLNQNLFNKAAELEELRLPEGLTTTPNGLAYGCKLLKTVKIPDTLTTMNADAFSGCESLEEIYLPEGLTTIGNSAFYDCKTLQDFVLPSTLTSIGSSAFYGTQSIKAIVIPSGVTTIKSQTFYQSKLLSRVVFPAGITSIEAQAFLYCNMLKDIDFSNATQVPTLANSNAFPGISVLAGSGAKIKVPAALYDEWIAATNWAALSDYIVAV